MACSASASSCSLPGQGGIHPVVSRLMNRNAVLTVENAGLKVELQQANDRAETAEQRLTELERRLQQPNSAQTMQQTYQGPLTGHGYQQGRSHRCMQVVPLNTLQTGDIVHLVSAHPDATGWGIERDANGRMVIDAGGGSPFRLLKHPPDENMTFYFSLQTLDTHQFLSPHNLHRADGSSDHWTTRTWCMLWEIFAAQEDGCSNGTIAVRTQRLRDAGEEGGAVATPVCPFLGVQAATDGASCNRTTTTSDCSLGGLARWRLVLAPQH